MLIIGKLRKRRARPRQELVATHELPHHLAVGGASHPLALLRGTAAGKARLGGGVGGSEEEEEEEEEGAGAWAAEKAR